MIELDSIGALITLYLPTILAVCGYIVNFLVLLSKVKSINITNEVKELMSVNKQLAKDNQQLRQKLNEVLTQLTRVEHKE